MIVMINNFIENKKTEYKQLNLTDKFYYLYFDKKINTWLVITNEIKTFSFTSLKQALDFIKLLKGAGL